ncbi:MAG: 2-oxo acid dehydrogenase subunit E2 [Propionibacteriales bacterium]|nr:2-oxo acid dehydrogenase subunit E2 [Propionibacteriales bacterium]
MARLLRMPEVAANATEAVLQEWALKESSAYAAADTLATVETEKAVVDVEAEQAGVLLRTLVPAGSRVEVGAPIALLGDPGEQVADIDGLLAELGATHAGAAAVAERRLQQARVFASPLARRLAREAGLSVEQLDGSGPGGRIVRRDVETAISAGATTSSQPDAQPDAQPSSVPGKAAFTDSPHSRMRTAIAHRLTESKQTIPHFYLRGTLRADRLLKLRAELNEIGPATISVNDLLIKAAARAHLLVPELNVIWTDEAVRRFSSVDLSIAVATEGGLVTPVLRGVESMSVSSVAASTQDLAERARSGTLRQQEIDGGTLTVTNLGMFGTEEFAAIINPPQAAILAVGAARREPVVRKDKLKVGTVLRVTLSVDHRAVDGVLAARWMAAFTSVVEHPVQILA